MGNNQSAQEAAAKAAAEVAAERAAKAAAKAAKEEKLRKEKELLSKPWRTNKKNAWTEAEVESMRDEIAGADHILKNYSEIEHFNVLLLGTPSSGKTALRNTVGSAFSDDILKLAFAGQSSKSLTKTLRAYPVRNQINSNDEKLNIKFWDTMGIDEHVSILVDHILDGRLQNGTRLDKATENQRAETETEIKHKMHCILFVINATKLSLLEDSDEMNMISEIVEKANSREVPSMLVLTHVDQICEHVDADTKTVFRSPQIKALIDKAADITGFAPLKIQPIRNYHKEGGKVTEIDFLTLLLLKNVTECCKEHVQALMDAQENY